MPYTLSGLNEGDVYCFYVVAVNSVGRSAASPILSVVAGTRKIITITIITNKTIAMEEEGGLI